MSDRKGKMMEIMLGGIVIVVTLVVLIQVLLVLIGAGKAKGAEQLCENFNQARLAGQVEIKDYPVFNLVKRAPCKKQSLKLPLKDSDLEGTMDDIGLHIQKCWKQWLEGRTDRISELLSSYKECVTCYSFEISKGIPTFQGSDLKKYLSDNVQIVRDTSDRCNINGGGYCIEEESCTAGGGTKVPSSSCSTGEICCNKANECENKGGYCRATCDTSDAEYAGWNCKEGRCCVEGQNMQSYEGVLNSNQGRILVAVDNFIPVSESYSITFSTVNGPWSDFKERLPNFGFPEEKANSIIISKAKRS